MAGIAKFVACITALIAVSVAWAQGLPSAKPADVGMSPERLGRITDGFRQEIDQGKLPGAVILVARKSKLVYSEAFGFQDRGKGTRCRSFCRRSRGSG